MCVRDGVSYFMTYRKWKRETEREREWEREEREETPQLNCFTAAVISQHR